MDGKRNTFTKKNHKIQISHHISQMMSIQQSIQLKSANKDLNSTQISQGKHQINHHKSQVMPIYHQETQLSSN
jgi:hypothetical protein